MPQDTPDAVSPLAPFEGSYEVPGLDLTQRWFDGRDITPDLRTQVLEVLRIAFNDRASWFALPVTPEDHFDWKFRDCPTGVTVALTLEPDGRVIGFLGSVRRIWLLKGRPYVSIAGYDLSRLPEWQGRGVSRALEPFREVDWHPSEDFSFAYINHPANRRLLLERGDRMPANETHDYIRLLHPLQKARALFGRNHPSEPGLTSHSLSNTAPVIQQRERRRADRLRNVISQLPGLISSLLARRPAPRNTPWTISTIPSFQQHHEPFISAALSEFDFVAERSISYLNWRYCDERAGPFTVRIAQQDGNYLGYAVTRVLNGAAYLADILVLAGKLPVAEALIHDSIDLANGAGASSILTRLPRRHPYRRALVRAGFFDRGHIAGELFNHQRMDPTALAFLDREDTRIHHVLADSDF